MNKKVFVLIGGKFYFDWFLPTNWSSKNPLFKLFYFRMKKERLIGVKTRYELAKFTGGIHLLFLIIFICECFYFKKVTNSDIFLNVLINLYPVFCQLYIGKRCLTVMRHKEQKRLNLELI